MMFHYGHSKNSVTVVSGKPDVYANLPREGGYTKPPLVVISMWSSEVGGSYAELA